MIGYFDAIKKLNEEQLEAVAVASASFVKRLQSVTGQAKDYSNTSFEHAQTFIGQIDDAIKLYADFVKASWQESIAQGSRNRDLYASFAKQALTSVETAVAMLPAAASTKV